MDPGGILFEDAEPDLKSRDGIVVLLPGLLDENTARTGRPRAKRHARSATV